MFTKAFLIAAAERAIKTFAQAAVAYLGVGVFGILDIDFAQLASVSGLAALVSVLTSIASDAITKDGPSLANETTVGK